MNLSLDKAFILKSIALVMVYLATAKIGLTFGTINNSATIFWPPGGIALTAVLIGGKRYLPAVFIAAYCAAVMVKAPLIFGLGSALGNTLEALIGFTLLTKSGKFKPELNRVNHLLAIFVLGALIPAMASAILGPVTLMLSGLINVELLPNIMWRWWRADVLGIAFFTPLTLVFVRKRAFFRDSAKFLEISALWLLSIVLGQMVFLAWHAGLVFDHPPNLAWLFPSLMWAGLRTGRRNTALIQLLFLSQSLASAYFNVGIFADDFNQYGLSNFWSFAMLLATLGMALAIMTSTERFIAHKNKQHAKVFEISNDGVLITDADNNIISVNAAFTDITGYAVEEVIGKNPRLLSSGRQSREFYADMWKTLIEVGHWQGEVWSRRKNGEAYPEYLSIATVKDDTGNICNYIGTIIDITTEKQKEEQRLNQEIALRNTLVREVHHRIKNSLQGVTSLLRQSLQQHPELHDAITNTIGQIRSIALTHGLQGKNAQSQVLLKDLVLEVAANNQILWHNNFNVDISPQLKSWIVNEEESVPLALVLNELALNAIKHHQLNSEIRIQLTEESLGKDHLNNGVAITFSNHGQLSLDAQSPNEPNKGTGLTLVDLLLSEHSELSWEQRDDLVIARLALKPPVISLVRNENNHVQ